MFRWQLFFSVFRFFRKSRDTEFFSGDRFGGASDARGLRHSREREREREGCAEKDEDEEKESESGAEKVSGRKREKSQYQRKESACVKERHARMREGLREAMREAMKEKSLKEGEPQD